MRSNVVWRKRRPYYDIYAITVIREQERLETITGFMVEKATTLHFAATARLRHKKCLISRFVRAVNERWRFSFFSFFCCCCCCFFNLKFMRSSLLKPLMFGSSFPSVGFLEHFFAATARLRHKKWLISRFVRAVNERWRFSFFHFFCCCCCFFNLKFMRSSLLKLLMFGSSFPSVG